MVSLHFIGVSHNDRSGAERLERALEVEDPVSISVESSLGLVAYMQSPAFRVGREAYLRKLMFYGARPHVTGALRKKFFELDGYDVRVPQEFARKKQIPFFLIDDPAQVEVVKQSIIEETRSLRRDYVANLNIAYARPDLYLEDPYNAQRALWGDAKREAQEVFNNLTHIKGSSGRREDIAAENLRRASEGIEGKFVHVCGAGHLLQDPQYRETLFSKLADFSPTRKLLCDY